VAGLVIATRGPADAAEVGAAAAAEVEAAAAEVSPAAAEEHSEARRCKFTGTYPISRPSQEAFR